MSQKQDILNHMQDGKPITPIEALELYQCFRLADVVFRLKADGWPIKTKIVSYKNEAGKNKSFGSYSLGNINES